MFERQIARGMAKMDAAYGPEVWRAKVPADANLDMRYTKVGWCEGADVPCGCVLAHVTGDADRACRALFPGVDAQQRAAVCQAALHHGFAADSYYDTLTQEWRDTLQADALWRELQTCLRRVDGLELPAVPYSREDA